jgi:hypothetical protein
MRNIDSSQFLRKPELDIVETKPNQPLGSSFTLYADQVITASEDDEKAAAKKGRMRFGGAGGSP